MGINVLGLGQWRVNNQRCVWKSEAARRFMTLDFSLDLTLLSSFGAGLCNLVLVSQDKGLVLLDILDNHVEL